MVDESLPTDLTHSRRLEHYLGPSAQRYFGGGYRRTVYALGRFGVQAEGETRGVATSAQVIYPTDWSFKDGVARQPHLSTVDALVLAAAGVRSALTTVGGLDEQQVRGAWFSDLTIKAGARPTTDLDQVPVRCDIVRSRHDAEGRSTTLRLKIGTFRVGTVVRHPSAFAETVEVPLAGTEPYSTVFRQARHQSRITQIDHELATMECVHQVEVAAGLTPGEGIEAAYGPQPTLIDSLVLAGQMMQVLIATVDGVSRAASGNLWMRHITFVARTPWRSPYSRSGLAILDRQVISRAGTTLHGVDARCYDLCGVDMTAKLAYTEDIE